MYRKYETFRIGRGGLPDGLAERMKKPWHIELDRHPLSQYVREDMIPPDLDLILLEDFNDFRHHLDSTSSRSSHVTYHGLYLSPDHCWMPEYSFKKAADSLKDCYGIEVSRAVLLPHERIDYWTTIHELLHDVFNNLPEGKRQNLVRSAVSSYEILQDMLDLSKVGITSFGWDFYMLPNLGKRGQLRCVDEFISSFITRDSVCKRHDPKHLPGQFRETLQEAGYNLISPSGVYKSRLEKFFRKLGAG